MITPLTEPVLRNIWKQATEDPNRVWNSREVKAIMEHMIYLRQHMKRNSVEIPKVDDGEESLTQDWRIE